MSDWIWYLLTFWGGVSAGALAMHWTSREVIASLRSSVFMLEDELEGYARENSRRAWDE